jgi:hypothetical protein
LDQLHCELESLDQKIVSVESQIQITEKEVSDLEQQLKVLRSSAVSDPNSRGIIEELRIDLAAKRKKEEQLRMKEEQLRMEQGQIRTEKQLRTREEILLLDEQNKNQGQRLFDCHIHQQICSAQGSMIDELF